MFWNLRESIVDERLCQDYVTSIVSIWELVGDANGGGDAATATAIAIADAAGAVAASTM